ATPIESAPFKGQSFFIMQVAPSEQPAADRTQNPFLPFEFVGPNYFRAFDIPILRGRGFTASDTKGAPSVVIVNETLARRFWPNADPIGKRLIQTLQDSAWTVIGVAKDTHFRELKNVGPIVYFDWEQMAPWWNGALAVRSKGSLAAVLP